ncbi:MAG: class I SAM-dependent methyltransferase [Crocinitomicaceae bacterium]|nr:class I SAM-dependent methyltransferase [Crocinitomicaceae bacterium]
MGDRTAHWERVYETKSPQEVSWTQDVPRTSLYFIEKYAPNKSAKIIDVGGGDSNLVDHLLNLGYNNLTVLDISSKAIERAKERLGEKASNVNWIVSDITAFEPEQEYDLWHDRAAFHFLTSDEDIRYYESMINEFARCVVLGTFSTDGPLKCSGLEITQYSEDKLTKVMSTYEVREFLTEDHKTPFDTLQNFIFGVFER